MSTTSERMELGNIIENFLPKIFNSQDIIIEKFGIDSIVNHNKNLITSIRCASYSDDNREQVVMIRHAPDFIIANKNRIFFLDTKYCVTPMYSNNRIKKLREKNNDKGLSVDRIGVIAREALLSYIRYYPNTIIVIACPYNKKLLMAQFAKDIKCLYCYSDLEDGYNCDNCPSKHGDLFNKEIVDSSSGSQTPYTNIDLNSFLPIQLFFEKINISVNNKKIEEMKNELTNQEIQFPDDVYETIKSRVKNDLRSVGCVWIK